MKKSKVNPKSSEGHMGITSGALKEKISGKYTALITASTLITKEHIEEIAGKLEKGIFYETACTTSGVDYETMHQFISKKRTFNDLAQYAYDAFKIAEAKAEENLVTKWLDTNQFNTKQIQAFLESTNPKFSRKYRTAMTYELAILLETVRDCVDESTFIQILDKLRELDRYEAIAKLDNIINQ